jgi:hypothetical protein
MWGANVTLCLSGENTLKSGKWRAGLEVIEGSTLTITSIDGDGKTVGTLTAHGGQQAAGIGGKDDGAKGGAGIGGSPHLCHISRLAE